MTHEPHPVGKKILIQVSNLLFDSAPTEAFHALAERIRPGDPHISLRLLAALGVLRDRLPGDGSRGEEAVTPIEAAEEALRPTGVRKPGIAILTDLCRDCTGKPCLEACPTGSLRAEPDGVEFNGRTCILCGKCRIACPLDAVLDASQVVETVRAILRGAHVTALLSPAAGGQYSGGVDGMRKALLALGFSEVRELAETAFLTIREEVRELENRGTSGKRFVTSSCCPSWVMATGAHLPSLEPYASDAGTPMHHAAAAAKDRNPETVTVFIGPCLAKKMEAYHDPLVDLVLTFEELDAMFIAKGIRVPGKNDPAGGGNRRGAERTGVVDEKTTPEEKQVGYRLPVSGGMAQAVATAGGGGSAAVVNGITKESLAYLGTLSPENTPGDFLEVMACGGGCVMGPGVRKRPAACADGFLYRIGSEA